MADYSPLGSPKNRTTLSPLTTAMDATTNNDLNNNDIDPNSPQQQEEGNASPRRSQDPNYMHRPPRIVPNYGKKHHGLLPKSNISRVLLYDNVTQEQMLSVRMSHLKAEQRKTGRIMDLQKKSFMARHLRRRRHLVNTLLHVQHALPPIHSPPSNNYFVPSSKKPTTLSAPVLQATEPTAIPQLPGASSSGTPVTLDTASEQLKIVVTQQDSAPLPELSRQRQGASTSSGFAHPPPGLIHKADRASRTAVGLGRVEDRLPEIDAIPGSLPASLRMDTDKSGLTRVMHTVRKAPARQGGKRRGKGRGGAKRGAGEQEGEGRRGLDERYRQLEALLVRMESPNNNGYLQLSPSFHLPRQTLAFTRPSSILTRPPSSDSALPRPQPLVLSSL